MLWTKSNLISMLGHNFKNRLKVLSLAKKMVLLGSGLALIGSLLPWYKDIDRFNTGDMFLGITGPLYLAGFIVLIGSVISFGIIMAKLLEKPTPKLPMKENYLHILAGGLSVFMLVLASSVYFHSKFGINLADKTMGIGMILGFIGAGLMLLGAFLSEKQSGVDFETEGKLEPLIDLSHRDREKGDLHEKVNDIHQNTLSNIDAELDKITNTHRYE